MYLFGLGVLKNYDKAMYWSKKAADQGDANGDFYLGTIYADGLGVPRNYRKALYWFKKSAEKGNARGEYGLGWMYYLVKKYQSIMTKLYIG